MSDSLQPRGLQRASCPCPPLSPGICSDSCPLSQLIPSNHLIICQSSLLLPSIFWVFSSESALRIRCPKYWIFSISPSNEYSGLISFRVDWFDLLAVQGTLKSSPAPQFERHEVLGTQPSLWIKSHIRTWLLRKPQLWLYGKMMISAF